MKMARELLPGDSFERWVNRAGGFAFAAPRGWKVDARGKGSLVRSFDRLVALSIVPDRSPEALEVAVDQYANRAAEALAGFRDGLRVKDARRATSINTTARRCGPRGRQRAGSTSGCG
jgi:hypothetical protein